ncbi:endonuclease/exonuclease/phosphatase family protein [Pedobacter sp. BAL39]|uniref:endonuclease/exonuclease/phosphatase family protein n=1 Tax=Pedobacter sp. BAL39 TaxID=391596 RepID=UPI000155B164|nr:endonuclease/exonuclease/phosphatase family protein [Pedobacter sp. BAL39]EDM34392.1 endonuclease/exonuclease/phosphatase family protein [Pedobacter sp. BAL39]
MDRSKPTFIDKLVRTAALILVLMLIMGTLAGKVDPRDFKYFPFFGLAYPYILMLNILMIVWWCIRKRWIFAGGTLALILLGWHALTATISLSGEKGEGSKADSSVVRMMTYNVHGFKPHEGQEFERVKHQMLKLIEDQNPDIIGFQEYYTRRRGTFDITDSLKTILKTPYYYFVSSSENDYEASGLAIFSKYPIVNKGVIPFGNNHIGNGSIFIDVEVHQKKLRVYNVHLQSISFDKQDYTYLDKVKKSMDPDLQPSKRIAGMLKNAFMKRSMQVDLMKAHMGNCSIPYLIAGDFNDTPASYAATQMTKSLKSTFREKGSGFGQTYNGKFPNFQIDYIAVTKDIEVLNHLVIPAKLSDHFPVRSDLRLTR